MKYSNTIAWKPEYVCHIHNYKLTITRVCGVEIPYCPKCLKASGRSNNKQHRAFKVNHQINKELGKNNYQQRIATKKLIRSFCTKCGQTTWGKYKVKTCKECIRLKLPG